MGVIPKPDQYEALENLLRDFIAQKPQTISSPRDLAERMAGKANLIKDVLRKTLADDEALQADISHVILSHGHIDHVGSLPLFAHAEIVLTATERADPKPCYFYDVRPMDWPDARYRRVTSEEALCEGITLIPTPGHTAGHLSAALSLPDGRQVILAADAINRMSEAEEGFADAKDPARAMDSYHLLMARAKATGAEVIYGHEPSQWPALRKAPEPY